MAKTVEGGRRGGGDPVLEELDAIAARLDVLRARYGAGGGDGSPPEAVRSSRAAKGSRSALPLAWLTGAVALLGTACLLLLGAPARLAEAAGSAASADAGDVVVLFTAFAGALAVASTAGLFAYLVRRGLRARG